jgi:hypothetical protein
MDGLGMFRASGVYIAGSCGRGKLLQDSPEHSSQHAAAAAFSNSMVTCREHGKA